MRTIHLIAGLAFLGLVTPALADQFYIVQDTTTKKCVVVKEKPTTETMVLVDENGDVFETEVAANDAVKKTKICTTN